MATLHLVRAPIQIDVLTRWAGERGWAGSRGTVFDEGRALHHLVAETIGPGAFRCFRLLVSPRKSTGYLYAYSPLDAAAVRDAARTHALPEHLDALGVDRMMSKPMPRDWHAGQRLGFDVRVRPIRRLRRPLDVASDAARPPIAAGREIDVFLLEALREHPRATDGMEKEGRTRQVVYLDWLNERFGGAATLDRRASRLARFRRVRVARRDHDSEGPDATLHGVLEVVDPTAFAARLARGIGRHRAYGYGMLLLRPPDKPAVER